MTDWAATQPQVDLRTLLTALVVGLLAAPLSALAHECAHAVAARRCGLVGVRMPSWDVARMRPRFGFGFSRTLGARDPHGRVRLHPAVPVRDAIRILAVGPAAEVVVAILLGLAGLLAATGEVRAVLACSALDCVAGAAVALLVREGGASDGAQLRRHVATLRAGSTAGDPNAATSFGPPGV